MEQKIIVKTLTVKGMTCPNCELRIENKLKTCPGVVYVEAKYANEIVRLTFDSGRIGVLDIIEAIESLGYTVESAEPQRRNKAKNNDNTTSGNPMSITSLLGVGIIILAIYLLIRNTIEFNFIPTVNQNMGYGILFIVGILTSLHCVAMCGGINLSQCLSYQSDHNDKLSKLKPSIRYNAGRVISYTLIGGIVGAIGSVISLSGIAKGFVAIVAGVFMIMMGLNMLNIFPSLRKLTPKMPKIFGTIVHNNQGGRGPFYVGLLNGLMPCGPLQTMQLYALGTGSFFPGALSMLMFSLGTVPFMFGFGAVSSMLSSKFTHKMMKISAVLVMVLGVIMLNNGLSLSGVNALAFNMLNMSDTSGASNNQNMATISSNVQSITTNLSSGRYSPITVQKGIPVKWTIQADASDINGCNNEMIIPTYNIQLKLQAGDNIVEFTPDKSGTIPYSCWMGMIRSTITVVDDLNETTESRKEFRDS